MLYFITTCVQTLRNNSRLFSALAIIALTAGATASAFAYTAGWLSPDRLTPARIVDALSGRGGDPTGHRRNHSKGICFTGYFEAKWSRVLLYALMIAMPLVGRSMLSAGGYPVVLLWPDPPAPNHAAQ